jgi:hypothetical protein
MESILEIAVCMRAVQPADIGLVVAEEPLGLAVGVEAVRAKLRVLREGDAAFGE